MTSFDYGLECSGELVRNFRVRFIGRMVEVAWEKRLVGNGNTELINTFECVRHGFERGLDTLVQLVSYRYK